MRTRPENAVTLKQAILAVLNARGRCPVSTIAEGILATGFLTSSSKFANTVRVQLYRLTDEGIICDHGDGSYSLRITLQEELATLIRNNGLAAVITALKQLERSQEQGEQS